MIGIIGEPTVRNVMFYNNVPRVMMCYRVTVRESGQVLYTGSLADMPEEYMSRYVERLEWKDSGNPFKPFNYTIDLEVSDDEQEKGDD